MAKRLLVEIIGNSASLERSLAESGAAAEGFRARLGTLAKTAVLAGGALALGGLAYGIDKSVKAAMEGQVSQARLDTALKATHQSVKAMTPALEAAQAASRKMGFADDESRAALARLEVATGSTKKSIADLGVAQDIARFKHTDLTSASQMLAMAMTGSQRAAKQLGITVPPVTSHMDQLRLSHEKLTTAAGMADAAHAKLADKLLTSKAIIQAVTDKVHGQADAFSQTAAGQMEQFHAQLTHMEEGLGQQLLPALVSVLDWVNSHWPQIQAVFQTVFTSIGQAITAVTPYFQMLIDWSKQAVEYVQAHWTQISAVVAQVMGAVKSAINDAVMVGKALWAEFGGALTSIARTYITALVGVIKGLYAAVVGVFQLVDDLIHGRWSQIWGDLKKIVSGALSAVISDLRGQVTIALTAALAIGKAIVQGVAKGLEALVGLITSAAWKLVQTAIAPFHEAGARFYEIGRNLIQGAISGILSMAKSIADAAVSVVHGAVSAAKKFGKILSPSRLTHDELGVPLGQGMIEGWITGSASLPDKMSKTMKAAIEAARKVIASSKSSFETAFGSLSSTADNMFSGIAGAMQTKSGKELAKLTAAHDAAGIKQGVQDARDALTTAQAGGDPAAILSAQQQLNEALYQQQVAALQIQAAEEQKQLDASNAVKQIAFDKALEKLQKHLAQGHTSTKTAMKEIETLLRKYGVTFGEVGRDMGKAWVQGLKDAITAAAKHGGSLTKVIQDQADSIKIPHAATGGYVAQTGLAVIHKGENVVPAGKGMGGGTVNIVVNGWVGNDQALAARLADEFNRTIGRQGNAGFSVQTN